jgi:hypothetical protein
METNNKFLIAGAICSGIAALLHLGCIAFGGDWYRFLGAGEAMAQMAEAGHVYPTVVTSVIVVVLSLWSLYALSGAGVIFRLPLLRLGLCVIAIIYLLRGIAFIFLIPIFPDNSVQFWLVSSFICLLFGFLYAVGIKQSWSHLGGNHAAN